MRNTLIAVLAVSLIATTAPIAGAQSRNDQSTRDQNYRDRDRGPGENTRNDQFYRNRDATQQELTAADARLNRVYQRRIAEAQAADRADRRTRPRGWYSQEVALREAERAWIAYRDSDCRYASQADAGSRLYPSVVRACLIDRTNDRTAVLQDARTTLSQR